jgi:hypothetical protein
MMKWMKRVVSILLSRKVAVAAVEDPTVYQIETTTRKYCGKIIYQDNVIIQLKIAKPKAVKILKANIEKIAMVQNESALQYYQRQNTRLAKINTITY